jgi:DNA-binding MarR family transcriptional regulator
MGEVVGVKKENPLNLGAGQLLEFCGERDAELKLLCEGKALFLLSFANRLEATSIVELSDHLGWLPEEVSSLWQKIVTAGLANFELSPVRVSALGKKILSFFYVQIAQREFENHEPTREPQTHRQASERQTRRQGSESQIRRHAGELLELFYPIHFQSNMAAEDAMRGELTRKQAAILWLIHSTGSENGRCLRRKEIVARLQDWFDVSGPAVTQGLRSMARPPLGLVRLVEDADSGREKRVFLTLKGERFVETMVERGRRFIQKMVVEHMPPDQVTKSIEFLRAGMEAFERASAMNDTGKLPREPRAAIHRMASGREPNARQLGRRAHTDIDAAAYLPVASPGTRG